MSNRRAEPRVKEVRIEKADHPSIQIMIKKLSTNMPEQVLNHCFFHVKWIQDVVDNQGALHSIVKNDECMTFKDAVDKFGWQRFANLLAQLVVNHLDSSIIEFDDKLAFFNLVRIIYFNSKSSSSSSLDDEKESDHFLQIKKEWEENKKNYKLSDDCLWSPSDDGFDFN